MKGWRHAAIIYEAFKSGLEALKWTLHDLLDIMLEKRPFLKQGKEKSAFSFELKINFSSNLVILKF